MPHATMQLIPGVDTNETPALNQAGFSQSQLVRFIYDRTGKGLVQKIGGWLAWMAAKFTNALGVGNVTELRAWEDLNSIARLAIGTTTGLFLASPSNTTPVPITPQTIAGDSPFEPTQTVTISLASPAVITPSGTVPINGTPVVFSNTGGALPANITAGSVYWVINSGATTYQISATVGGTPISTNGNTQSGTQSTTIPTASTTSGSSTVTIYDFGTGVQSVTFASSKVTVGAGPSGAAGIVPTSGTPVKFLGSIAAELTAGTTYYVINPTATGYSLSATAGGAAITFTAGTGTQYIPNFFQAGYSFVLYTPISIANLVLSGTYTIVSTNVLPYYNSYTITASIPANATTSNAALPTFALTSGVNYITVTQPNTNTIAGQTVTFAYPTVSSGVTISGSYIVASNPAPTSSTYQISASSAATATTTVTMNGGYVHFVYYFNIPSGYAGGGYGSGGYGSGGYGVGVSQGTTTVNTITTTDWTINNFGEILVANPQDGPIYYWSPTNNTQTAYLLATAPLLNRGIFIAMPARQIVAYGSTVTGIQDPLLIRWSDAADATVWIASANNQAGSYRIPEGSQIVGAIQAPQQALIFTDLAVWAMVYVGLPNVYGFNKIGDGAGLIGKKAVGLMNGVTYWMSPQKFMLLSGEGPVPIPCPVWDKVFQNINTSLYSLIRCATNSVFGEVVWYYPSTNATYNDSYVKYNIANQQWDYGSLDRTAWIDQSVLGPPIGASSDGSIFQHELGYNAGTNAMTSSFQTGYIQLNEADSMVFVDQIWPDFKFTTAGGGTGGVTQPATVYVTFYGANYPGDTPTVYGPYAVTQNTEYISTRIRNRLLSIGVSTADGNGVSASSIFYRIGAMRYRYQLDGKF